MERKHSFILALLITMLILTNYMLFSLIPDDRETGIVSRVIDGDTLVLEDGRTIRLLNINSPERGSDGYDLALDFVKPLEGQAIEFEITSSDKYDRALARIYTPNYINLELVKQGLATKFLVEKSERKKFDRAEIRAIENSLGIWKKSEFYDCLKSEIDEKAEIITLKNLCQPVNIKDWTITDESSKTYKLPSHAIGEVKIHSFEGDNNGENLYWNKKTNVWNNDRDTLYVFDDKGSLVHYHSYGY